MMATSKKRRDLTERESIFINMPIGVRCTCFSSVTQWISAFMLVILLFAVALSPSLFALIEQEHR